MGFSLLKSFRSAESTSIALFSKAAVDAWLMSPDGRTLAVPGAGFPDGYTRLLFLLSSCFHLSPAFRDAPPAGSSCVISGEAGGLNDS